MGVEQNYERIFIGEPHWRNPYNSLKAGADTTTLASGFDKGLSSDCRNEKMKGLKPLYDTLATICETVQEQLLILESDKAAMKEAYISASQEHPKNKKILEDFYKTAIRRLKNAVAGGEDLASPGFPKAVLTEVLKQYAVARLEPAVAIALRDQKVHPNTVETRILEAIGKVNFDKKIQKIIEGVEAGPNAVRASVYQRNELQELANASLLGRK